MQGHVQGDSSQVCPGEEDSFQIPMQPLAVVWDFVFGCARTTLLSFVEGLLPLSSGGRPIPLVALV